MPGPEDFRNAPEVKENLNNDPEAVVLSRIDALNHEEDTALRAASSNGQTAERLEKEFSERRNVLLKELWEIRRPKE